MRSTTSVLVAVAAMAYALPAFAQNGANADTLAKAAPAASADSSPAKAEPSNVQPMLIQRLRPVDARGINVYESPKNDGIPYTGFKLGWGAAFTQQFQGLEHSNTAEAVIKFFRDTGNRRDVFGCNGRSRKHGERGQHLLFIIRAGFNFRRRQSLITRG